MDYGSAASAAHRRAHLLAVLEKAHEDDERMELERQLAEIDAAIARGVALPPEERRRRAIQQYRESHPPDAK